MGYADLGDDQLIYHRDQIGSIRAVTQVKGDATQEVVWHADYKPFGEMLTEFENDEWMPLLTFALHEHDAETGLIYAKMRWLDYETGQFTTEDPAMDGLNWYAYVGGNVTGAVDPLGLEDHYINGNHYYVDRNGRVFNLSAGAAEVTEAKQNAIDQQSIANNIQSSKNMKNIAAKQNINYHSVGTANNTLQGVANGADLIVRMANHYGNYKQKNDPIMLEKKAKYDKMMREFFEKLGKSIPRNVTSGVAIDKIFDKKTEEVESTMSTITKERRLYNMDHSYSTFDYGIGGKGISAQEIEGIKSEAQSMMHDIGLLDASLEETGSISERLLDSFIEKYIGSSDISYKEKVKLAEAFIKRNTAEADDFETAGKLQPEGEGFTRDARVSDADMEGSTYDFSYERYFLGEE